MMDSIGLEIGSRTSDKTVEALANAAKNKKHIYGLVIILFVGAYFQYVFTGLGAVSDGVADWGVGIAITAIFIKMYVYSYYALALELFVFHKSEHYHISCVKWLLCAIPFTIKAWCCCYCCRLTICKCNKTTYNKRYNKMQRFDPDFKKYNRIKKFLFLLGIVDFLAEVGFFIYEFIQDPSFEFGPIRIAFTGCSVSLAIGASLLSYYYIK